MGFKFPNFKNRKTCLANLVNRLQQNSTDCNWIQHKNIPSEFLVKSIWIFVLHPFWIVLELSTQTIKLKSTMEKSANQQVKYIQEPIKNWFSSSILSQFSVKEKGLNDKGSQRPNLNKLYVTNFDINAVSPCSF